MLIKVMSRYNPYFYFLKKNLLCKTYDLPFVFKTLSKFKKKNWISQNLKIFKSVFEYI